MELVASYSFCIEKNIIKEIVIRNKQYAREIHDMVKLTKYKDSSKLTTQHTIMPPKPPADHTIRPVAQAAPIVLDLGHQSSSTHLTTPNT